MNIIVETSQGGTVAGAVWTNVNTGQTWTEVFYSPGEEYDARGLDAEWVIEDPPELTLGNFETIQFTGAGAFGPNSATYGVTGGTTIDYVKDGVTIATGTIVSDSEVDVTYNS